HDAFREQVLDSILAGSAFQGRVSRAELRSLLAMPPKFELGQAAVPCHTLARALRQPPAKIAEEVAREASARGLGEYVEGIEALNGFLNFRCRFEAYGARLLGELRDGSHFSKPF